MAAGTQRSQSRSSVTQRATLIGWAIYLAGTLMGFAVMATLSHYPTPLIGYGAAPVIGYALALGLCRGTRA